MADISAAEANQKNTYRSATAYQAAQRVGIQSVVESGTAIVYAAPAGGNAFESPELGGGVFSRSLFSTLQSQTGPVSNGILDLNKLPGYLDAKIASNFDQQPMPLVVTSGSTNIPIWSPGKAKVLSIGISNYKSSAIPALRYASRDAEAFGSLMNSHGAEATVLLDATESDIVSKIDTFGNSGDGSETFVMYFSGHGWNSNGVQELAAIDSGGPYRSQAEVAPVAQEVQARGLVVRENGLSLRKLMDHINRLPFRYRLVLIDACATSVDK